MRGELADGFKKRGVFRERLKVGAASEAAVVVEKEMPVALVSSWSIWIMEAFLTVSEMEEGGGRGSHRRRRGER